MGRKRAIEDAEALEPKKKTRAHQNRGKVEHRKLKTSATTKSSIDNTSPATLSTEEVGSKPKVDTGVKPEDQSITLHQSVSLEESTKEQILEQDSQPEKENQEASQDEADDHVTGILPAHLAHLIHKYSFATISIKNHSHINTKVTTMIRHMSKFDFMDPSLKPGIVVLDAKSSDANKMISIVEIAKKNIFENSRSGKWYQYNRVGSTMSRISRKAPTRYVKAVKEVRTPSDEQSVELHSLAGQSGTKEPQSVIDTKLRAIPTLTIYMARVPIPELRAEFGEQTNANDIVKWWEPLAMTRK